MEIPCLFTIARCPVAQARRSGILESMNTHRIPLVGISARAWEHPADKAALAALRRIPGLDVAIKAISGMTSDRALRLFFLASAIRVGEHQLPKLSRLLESACDTLDLPLPELFVSNHPVANAGAIGMERPFILLHSSLIDQLDEAELLFVLGHELGHIASGHVVYRTMVELLLHFGRILAGGGLPPLVVGGIMIGLLEWYRKSELSADRAGLLACQDPLTAYGAFMKLAGGKTPATLELDGFLLQAAEYQKSVDILDDIWKSLNLLGQTHPFPVLRLAELKPWVDGGAYATILTGVYPRRADDRTDWQADPAGMFKNFDEAGKSYQADFDRSEGPLKDGFSHLGKAAGDAAKEAERWFRSIFG
jgi:Zn-dependent protease with chaperone function